MSASREKKQRQASQETKLSARAQEEQKKQAQRKRNTITYSIIAVVIVILVAILLIWNSGMFQRRATVATINGEDITAPEVTYYYYNNSVIQLAQLYAQWGVDGGYAFDLNKSPKAQFVTVDDATQFGIPDEYVGRTYHEYFLNEALGELVRVNYLCARAEEAGYALSEEGKTSVSGELDYIDSVRDQYLTHYGADLSRTAYLQMVYGDTMNEKTYKTCVEKSVLASEFYTEHFDQLTDYTEAELDAYYQEHAVALNSVSYYWRFVDGSVKEEEHEHSEDEDHDHSEDDKDDEDKKDEVTQAEKEAAMAAAKKEAEGYVGEIEADFEIVRDNEDYTHADGVLSISSTYYDWLTDPDRKEGDVTIFDAASGYYVVAFERTYLDTSKTVNVRHILISAMPEDDKSTTDKDESKNDPSEENYAAAKTVAENLLNEFVANNGTEEDFAALANLHSADAGSNTLGGLYEKVSVGRMIPSFNDWIFDESRQSGDIGIVQNTESSVKGWHIIYFVGDDEPVWVTSARSGKWLDDLESAAEITRSEKLDSYFA